MTGRATDDGAPHPLDRPVWHALTTRQAGLIVAQPGATGAAVRIDPAFGPFAAARDPGEAAQAALAATLRDPGDRVFLVERAPWPAPRGTRVVQHADLVQMIADGALPPVPADDRIVLLGAGDAAMMAALARAAEPGPWASATHLYGPYYGIRIDGALAAMAGQRLLLPGLAELSGVACWPHHRGQGLARALVARVCAGFAARGDTPFLHCYAANAGAIRLYETLGFRLRARLVLTALALA